MRVTDDDRDGSSNGVQQGKLRDGSLPYPWGFHALHGCMSLFPEGVEARWKSRGREAPSMWPELCLFGVWTTGSCLVVLSQGDDEKRNIR